MSTAEERLLREFGKNLKKLRTERGFSTRKFAIEADISTSSLARLESGSTNPSLTTLLKLADALRVDLNKLSPKK